MNQMLGLPALAIALQSCALAPATGPNLEEISSNIRHEVMSMRAAIGVCPLNKAERWIRRSDLPPGFSRGSATPITNDGYFLTADHVLWSQPDLDDEQSGQPSNLFVFYPHPQGLVLEKARIVWRSKRNDLALLHINGETPRHFEWVPADQWIAKGTKVMHGGISSAEHSESGGILTTLSPERTLTGHRFFKMDLRLRAGDSGGPVVNADGLLVGINSAVEFSVAGGAPVFTNSQGCRPSLRQLMKIITSDRGARK